MTASILTILGALATILGPVAASWVVVWAERKHTEATHATVDEVDEHIQQHFTGNPAGLVSLSRQLERLQREATRKRHSP